MRSISFPSNKWHPPQPGSERYLLLDGAQCKSPGDVLARFSAVTSATRLFDGILSDGTADATVQLLRLSAGFDLQLALNRSPSSVKSHGALTFIDSQLTQSELTQRLMRRLDATLPNGKDFLVRFYDGRVLPWLLNVLTLEQRRDYLALGDAWWFVSHNLTWLSADLSTPDNDPFQPPLHLDDAQRRQLIDDTYPYTLIDHFVFTDRELIERIPADDTYRFIRKYTRLAEQYGIRDGKRIVMVCTWALLAGEDFHLDPVWQKRLKDFAIGRRTARDIGDEVWPVVESWE